MVGNHPIRPAPSPPPRSFKGHEERFPPDQAECRLWVQKGDDRRNAPQRARCAPIPAVRGAAFEPRDSVESRCGAMAEGWAYLKPHVPAGASAQTVHRTPSSASAVSSCWSVISAGWILNSASMPLEASRTPSASKSLLTELLHAKNNFRPGPVDRRHLASTTLGRTSSHSALLLSR
jgi:hypothetical protein